MNPSSKSTASKPIRIAITTGDPDGIGWEVTAKALNQIGPRRGIHYTVFCPRDQNLRPKLSKDLKKVISLEEETESAARWVERAAEGCLAGEFDALVTAPLSKTSIIESGLRDIGHTEILARISGRHDLFMAFMGAKFNVILATGHLPLSEALKRIDSDLMEKALHAARDFKNALSKSRQALPFALVGVNPHSGENGLIGSEEIALREWVSRTNGEVVGPLVPDAAFLPKNWPLYAGYISLYHDQGLIPFKMAHGFSDGVHLTLGLPFVRTSVDHGTAKELFGKNKADPGSMKKAILAAVRLASHPRH